MRLSNQFEDLILKQLECFGCLMGVKHLMVYVASAKEDSKARFELISQWPQIKKSLLPIDDDPEIKVASPNRRWYPIQEKDILIGVLRVETDFVDGNWPLNLDSRLKALSITLAKSFAIEIERQRNYEEITSLRSQVAVISHQLRNPLAALRTYAKLLIKRLGSDNDAIEIVESMLTEQKQINQYVSSFEQLNQPINIPIIFGEERLLLPPNLGLSKKNTVQNLLEPILERGKANALLQKKIWSQSFEWPDWTLKIISSKYAVIAEIVANLLENAFKYSNIGAEIGIIVTISGILVFDNGHKITSEEREDIFKKGFRGSASKKRPGTGVGLYLARKLAHQIGGELKLIDDNLGQELNFDNKDPKKNNMFYLEIPTGQLHE